VTRLERELAAKCRGRHLTGVMAPGSADSSVSMDALNIAIAVRATCPVS
jgi:hypothetical protein